MSDTQVRHRPEPKKLDRRKAPIEAPDEGFRPPCLFTGYLQRSEERSSIIHYLLNMSRAKCSAAQKKEDPRQMMAGV
jgi:hypothetical protein